MFVADVGRPAAADHTPAQRAGNLFFPIKHRIHLSDL
jgi:hypothetical protein